MKFCSFILIISSLNLWAQSDTTLLSKEHELKEYLTVLRNADSDEQKLQSNEEFRVRLKQFLQREGGFDHEFSMLPTVGVIDSPDNKVRIVNWNIEMDDLSHRFFCIVLHKYGRKNELVVTEFNDNPTLNTQLPDGIVQPNNWYGALYYQIIPIKKGNKDVYTILGWDGYNTLSNLKVVDALTLTSSTARLGAPIFEQEGKLKYRLFYQFAEKTSMYLHYEKDNDRIMMDHLSPESPSLKGFYEFYVPDLSFDALIYNDKKWALHEDVIGLNEGQNDKKDEQEVYTMDENGNLVKVEIKDKWQDPTDLSSPGSDNIHVAVTVDENDKGQNAETGKHRKKKKSKEDSDIDKKDKRDPSNLSTVTGGSRNRKKKNK